MEGSIRFNSYIRQEFGETAVKHVLSYENGLAVSTKFTQRRDFLFRCRDDKITPTFILDKVNNLFSGLEQQQNGQQYPIKIKREKDKICKRILNLEIKICCWTLRKSLRELETSKNSLKHTLPINIYDRFIRSQSDRAQNIERTSRDRLIKKHQDLLNNQPTKVDVYYDESCVVNLTNVDLPIETTILLSFGPNFALPLGSCQIPYLKILSEIETSLTSFVHPILQNGVRADVTEKITNYIKQPEKNTKFQQFYRTIAQSTRKFLKQHDELLITQTDKGNKTVVITRETYKQKMEMLLSDTHTYSILSQDPTKNIENKNNNFINRLFLNKQIDNTEKLRLQCDTSIPPRIYGLTKIHKPNIPLRPIVSTIGSSTYNSSKKFSSILRNIADLEKYNIKNSFEFKSFIDNITLKPNEVLVSFDVVSLFTNVPTKLALAIVDKKWPLISECTNISKPIFMEYLRFIVQESSYFQYDDKFYKQNFGLAMGSPLAPILSDLVLEFLFDNIIPKLDFQPNFIKKYVDDCILGIPEDKIQYTLDKFNSFHPTLKFTCETEDTNKSIAFLDLKLIHKNDGKVLTDWYNKPLASNRLLNFRSTHPLSQKRNVASSFIRRVLDLSDKTFRSKNTTIAFNILLKNNYPMKLIKQLINQHLSRSRKPLCEPQKNTSNKNTSMQSTTYSGLQYIPHMSQSIRNILENNSPKLKIAFSTPNSLKKTLFTNTKQKIEPLDRSGVVYKIDCLECDASYIGETSKKLKKRIQQHKNDVVNKDKPGNKTALVNHILEKKHKFDFEQAKIIDYEKNAKKRLIIETGHILMNKTVNLKTDSRHLGPIYHNIIDTHRRNRSPSPLQNPPSISITPASQVPDRPP
jgi:GIY-YIG catalytic domain